jgi:hypothetical protein
MKRSLLLFVLLFTATVFAASPFQADRGLVEIPVTLNGVAKGTFGIDTGADRLYIDKSFAVDNGLMQSAGPAKHQVAGLDGTTGGRNLAVRSIEFGGERLLNVNAVVVDLNALTYGHDDDHPDGLIGYDILERTYLTIDFPARELEARFDRPDFLTAGTCPSVRFHLFNHLIIVDVTFPDRVVRPMILDYGSSVTWLSDKVAQELGLSDGSPDEFQQVDSLSLGGVISTGPVVVGVRNLDAYLRSLPGLEVDGILGASFLYCHRITVNYRQNEIYPR